MASFYYPGHSYGNSMSGHHTGTHHGRSRRGPRMSSSQNVHRQHLMRTNKSPKQQPQNPLYNAYIKDLEAARSFDIEDDEAFCPFHLLTEDDLQSIHSSTSSDRSSLSSASPEASPLQQQVQPTPPFLLPSAANFSNPASTYHARAAQHQQQQMKIHQPMAQRSRNAIPIVDPSTRSVASPPPSVSPARQMQHQYARRW